jgi:predicted nucleic acid-binding protein
MGQTHLIDSNVIIDYFGDKLPARAKLFLDNIEPVISAVTKIEVLGWYRATESQLKPFYSLMDFIIILPINDIVINETIALRQKRRIRLGDAIIAATALANNLTLITRNAKDFDSIDGLALVNPFDL